MIAAQYDITLDRAAEYNFAVTVQNSAGSPVNLTGGAVYAVLRLAVGYKRNDHYRTQRATLERNSNWCYIPCSATYRILRSLVVRV